MNRVSKERCYLSKGLVVWRQSHFVAQQIHELQNFRAIDPVERLRQLGRQVVMNTAPAASSDRAETGYLHVS
jgi:hypothetical protein